MTTRHRLIVGVDYGTTYSGVSFVTTDKSNIEDIIVIRSWPGKDGEWKVPTRLAYSQENNELQKNAWGYEVMPKMASCSWTKLLLDINAKDRTYDDPNLQRAVDGGMLHLPPHIEAQQVCSDFLKELHTYMTSRMEKKVSSAVLAATPVDCWLTVPAVWSDNAQIATKRAAQAAGFGCRPEDTINIITEPEAAAIAALKAHQGPNTFDPVHRGENVLVCDCGGGTVDITTYSIEETEPRLEFEEICVGGGGKCGSTYIDRNLYQLMETRFGRAFETMKMTTKGPGSRFMNTWESVKRSFTQKDVGIIYEIGPLRMEGVSDSAFYDEEEAMARLTWSDVEGLFQPVVKEIIRLVSDQKHQAEQANHSLDRIILIGGFGDSDYLHTRLKQWCMVNGGIKLLVPDHPQAAIVRGAAIRGLEGTAPRKKRCRRYYGVAHGSLFKEGIDPEERAYIDRWDGAKRCSGKMTWLIQKGDIITKDTKASINLFLSASRHDELYTTDQLYSCSLDNPPEYNDHPRVERVTTIRTDFSGIDKSKVPHKRTHGLYGTKLFCLTFEVVVEFGRQSGVLEFKTLVGGKVSGLTTVTYD